MLNLTKKTIKLLQYVMNCFRIYHIFAHIWKAVHGHSPKYSQRDRGGDFCRFRPRPALALPYTGCETGINNESALAAQFPDLLRSSATMLPSGEFFFAL